jgi:hypothetical protein
MSARAFSTAANDASATAFVELWRRSSHENLRAAMPRNRGAQKRERETSRIPRDVRRMVEGIEVRISEHEILPVCVHGQTAHL